MNTDKQMSSSRDEEAVVWELFLTNTGALHPHISHSSSNGVETWRCWNKLVRGCLLYDFKVATSSHLIRQAFADDAVSELIATHWIQHLCREICLFVMNTAMVSQWSWKVMHWSLSERSWKAKPVLSLPNASRFLMKTVRHFLRCRKCLTVLTEQLVVPHTVGSQQAIPSEIVFHVAFSAPQCTCIWSTADKWRKVGSIYHWQTC